MALSKHLSGLGSRARNSTRTGTASASGRSNARGLAHVRGLAKLHRATAEQRHAEAGAGVGGTQAEQHGTTTCRPAGTATAPTETELETATEAVPAAASLTGAAHAYAHAHAHAAETQSLEPQTLVPQPKQSKPLLDIDCKLGELGFLEALDSAIDLNEDPVKPASGYVNLAAAMQQKKREEREEEEHRREKEHEEEQEVEVGVDARQQQNQPENQSGFGAPEQTIAKDMQKHKPAAGGPELETPGFGYSDHKQPSAAAIAAAAGGGGSTAAAAAAAAAGADSPLALHIPIPDPIHLHMQVLEHPDTSDSPPISSGASSSAASSSGASTHCSSGSADSTASASTAITTATAASTGRASTTIAAAAAAAADCPPAIASDSTSDSTPTANSPNGADGVNGANVPNVDSSANLTVNGPPAISVTHEQQSQQDIDQDVVDLSDFASLVVMLPDDDLPPVSSTQLPSPPPSAPTALPPSSAPVGTTTSATAATSSPALATPGSADPMVPGSNTSTSATQAPTEGLAAPGTAAADQTAEPLPSTIITTKDGEAIVADAALLDFVAISSAFEVLQAKRDEEARANEAAANLLHTLSGQGNFVQRSQADGSSPSSEEEDKAGTKSGAGQGAAGGGARKPGGGESSSSSASESEQDQPARLPARYRPRRLPDQRIGTQRVVGGNAYLAPDVVVGDVRYQSREAATVTQSTMKMGLNIGMNMGVTMPVPASPTSLGVSDALVAFDFGPTIKHDPITMRSPLTADALTTTKMRGEEISAKEKEAREKEKERRRKAAAQAPPEPLTISVPWHPGMGGPLGGASAVKAPAATSTAANTEAAKSISAGSDSATFSAAAAAAAAPSDGGERNDRQSNASRSVSSIVSRPARRATTPVAAAALTLGVNSTSAAAVAAATAVPPSPPPPIAVDPATWVNSQHRRQASASLAQKLTSLRAHRRDASAPVLSATAGSPSPALSTSGRDSPSADKGKSYLNRHLSLTSRLFTDLSLSSSSRTHKSRSRSDTLSSDVTHTDRATVTTTTSSDTEHRRRPRLGPRLTIPGLESEDDEDDGKGRHHGRSHHKSSRTKGKGKSAWRKGRSHESDDEDSSSAYCSTSSDSSSDDSGDDADDDRRRSRRARKSKAKAKARARARDRKRGARRSRLADSESYSDSAESSESSDYTSESEEEHDSKSRRRRGKDRKRSRKKGRKHRKKKVSRGLLLGTKIHAVASTTTPADTTATPAPATPTPTSSSPEPPAAASVSAQVSEGDPGSTPATAPKPEPASTSASALVPAPVPTLASAPAPAPVSASPSGSISRPADRSKPGRSVVMPIASQPTADRSVERLPVSRDGKNQLSRGLVDQRRGSSASLAAGAGVDVPGYSHRRPSPSYSPGTPPPRHPYLENPAMHIRSVSRASSQASIMLNHVRAASQDALLAKSRDAMLALPAAGRPNTSYGPPTGTHPAPHKGSAHVRMPPPQQRPTFHGKQLSASEQEFVARKTGSAFFNESKSARADRSGALGLPRADNFLSQIEAREREKRAFKEARGAFGAYVQGTSVAAAIAERQASMRPKNVPGPLHIEPTRRMSGYFNEHQQPQVGPAPPSPLTPVAPYYASVYTPPGVSGASGAAQLPAQHWQQLGVAPPALPQNAVSLGFGQYASSVYGSEYGGAALPANVPLQQFMPPATTSMPAPTPGMPMAMAAPAVQYPAPPQSPIQTQHCPQHHYAESVASQQSMRPEPSYYPSARAQPVPQPQPNPYLHGQATMLQQQTNQQQPQRSFSQHHHQRAVSAAPRPNPYFHPRN